MPGHDMSLWGLFLQADLVVKSVMVLLLLASVAAWSIIIDKSLRLRSLRRDVTAFEDHLDRNQADLGAIAHVQGIPGHALNAGHDAWRGHSTDESRAEFRERMERAMRAESAVHLHHLEIGLPFLATLGSCAPFIGLFGTVWGIMNSFTAIAKSNDTSLAVVAPGIAEALFATAIGLAAAIPAVIAYNKISVDLGRLSNRMNAGIAKMGDWLSTPKTARHLRGAAE